MRKKLEGDIEEEEITNAIKKLKRRKATGIDGISNEAWIEGMDQIKEELKKGSFRKNGRPEESNQSLRKERKKR